MASESDRGIVLVTRTSESENETEHRNGLGPLLIGGSQSVSTSRRPSFLIGELNNQIPVTIVGPDDEEITMDDIVVPPDGGWGWVVVFAAFMSNLIVDGTIFSFGIMQDEIVKSSSPIETERVPLSTVAWVGSLLFGFTLLSGPFVSSLANKFGFRVVGMAGSIASSLTFAAAWALSDHETGKANMPAMFIIYGILGGIGFSLIYVPAVITVGFYFDKKRALATGIAICGSGCGTFIFAPLSAYLIKEFQWNNAMLIQAGLIFSCLIFASLYRPLLPVRKSHFEDETMIQANGTSSPQTTPLLMRIKRARDMEKWDSINSIGNPDGLTENQKLDKLDNNYSKILSPTEKFRRSSYASSLLNNSNNISSEHRKISLPTMTSPLTLQVPNRQTVGSCLNEIVEEAEHVDINEMNEKNINQSSRRPTGDSRISNKSRRISTTVSIKDWDDSNNPNFRRRRTSVTLMLSNSALINTGEMSQSRVLRLANKGILNKPLYRDDIFLTGSLQAVPEISKSKSNFQIGAVFSSMDIDGGELSTKDNGKKSKKCKLDIVKKMLDFSLLKSPTFLLLALSGFITLLGYSVPFIYLKSLAVKNEVDPYKATLLVSIIGITNTVGRIISGGIADSPKVNSLMINNGALTIGGLATGVVPLIGNFGFSGYVTYSCIFGFSMACFASLRSILLVELLGLSKLTNAFGLLLLFQGIAAMCGSPLAGLLFDLTGNFDMSFYVAGLLMLVSGIMCYPLNSINRWENRRNKENNEDFEGS